MSPEDSKSQRAAGAASAEFSARLDQAALWQQRIGEDGAITSTPEFVRWSADPQNQKAFDAVSATWQLIDDHSATPELMELRRAALTDAQRQHDRRQPTRLRLWVAAASAVAIVLAAVAFFAVPTKTSYVTAIGERRVITLIDGSRLSLDSDTAVTVRYTTRARLLSLDRGRSRFEVARDTTRPFIVEARSERVLAVGTVFNVERLGEKVIVTLIEGKVTVTPTEADDSASAPSTSQLLTRSVVLKAGEQLIASNDAMPLVEPANLKAATAWESGRLEFHDEALGEAVERINRYATNPVVLDPSVAGLRISGVFKAGDVSGFVDAVTTYFPVAAAAEQGRVKLYAVRH